MTDFVTNVTYETEQGHEAHCIHSECFESFFGDEYIKCFTHDVSVEQNTGITKIMISFDKKIRILEESYQTKIYFHYPGQFFRSSTQPAMRNKISDRYC